jgi:hypothetical protein
MQTVNAIGKLKSWATWKWMLPLIHFQKIFGSTYSIYSKRKLNLHISGKKMLPSLQINIDIGLNTAKINHNFKHNRHMEDYEEPCNIAFSIFPFRIDFNQYFYCSRSTKPVIWLSIQRDEYILKVYKQNKISRHTQP